MIPRRLFYCWFGPKPYSLLNMKCLASWHKYLPDYEIVKISEENFDYSTFPLALEAYKKKAFALVADIARFEALKQGGFYLDLDTELFQSLDSMRDNDAILATVQNGLWGNGVLGCQGGELPEIYQYAYDNFLENGVLMMESFTHTANQKFNLIGDDYAQVEGIGFYGERYIASPRSRLCADTIALHHEENTWVDGWTPKFSGFVEFVPFRIYRAGHYDEAESKKWYSSLPCRNARLDILADVCVDVALLGKANFFYNPKVIGLSGRGYKFSREGSGKPTRKRALYDGDILEYEV